MSHFTLLVTGNNPEKQLEPFNENLEMTPYVTSEVTDEDKQSFLNTYRTYDPKRTYAQLTFEEVESNKLRTFEELYDEYGSDWNGNSWEFRDGRWVKTSTRNPNSKWDWYVMGGRWDGFLWLTNGSCANSAYKRDVSFEAKSKDRAQKAREEYLAVQALFPDGVIPTIEHSWESLGDVYSDITERRNAYWSQNSVVLWEETIRNANNNLKYLEHEDFQCSEEEYVKRAYDAANVTFAVLHEGKWYERGEMGWWDIVHNEKADWDVEFNNLIKGLPDHTLLTVFDCHI